MKWLLSHADDDTDECVTWPYATIFGYPMLTLFGATHRPSRMVCLHRHGAPIDEGMEAAHGPCNNRACLNSRHLSWKTPYENSLDKVRDGTMVEGDAHTQSKLRSADIPEIMRQVNAGHSYRSVAAQYNVSRTAIRNVAIGKTWKSVPRH